VENAKSKKKENKRRIIGKMIMGIRKDLEIQKREERSEGGYNDEKD